MSRAWALRWSKQRAQGESREGDHDEHEKRNQAAGTRY
jgi:hypothetical protein